ncbi:MAG: phenylalanine--tRNA ligase subunit alpha [Bacteroidales bacterium OttesenSCG-928-I14]|jgi:phenylalanyl-tRNA synthetase alpha chain|nr:phenylalanine--tRNA ligase subunit alpha [Bacteroidales bacterium OttesenSCG-928-I14]
MIEKIELLCKEIDNLKVDNNEELENLRILFLGKKGKISLLMNDFRNIEANQKPKIGKKLNLLKTKIKNKINQLKKEFEYQNFGNNLIDLTRTAYPYRIGTRHPISIVERRICKIFSKMGFSIIKGQEIEDDWHVFSALNFTSDHPARDMQDTFFINCDNSENILLRTHTSSVQIRTMEKIKPPIRIICPGRVYRNETISARTHCFFHQIEAFYVNRNISFSNLKQILTFFVKEMFSSKTIIRMRPSFFPFTEPSAEIDINCNLCKGKGCSLCKNTGWVEILGCGMIDPKVLDNCGINSRIYSGYALGIGIERIASLKYQVEDIRFFSKNDIRFLRQFEATV